MLVKLETAVFNDQTLFRYLDQLLILIEDGMHELIIEVEQEDDIMESDWVKSLGERHVEIIIELITKTIDREQFIGLKEKTFRGVLMLTATDDSYNIATRIKSLIEPLCIVVEDVKSDRSFIVCLAQIYRNASKRLRIALKQGWAKFEHAGGKTHIVKVIEAIFLSKPAPYKPRVFVIMDSDKLFREQDFNKEIINVIKFCSLNNIPAHIFYKREIENYLPEDVLQKKLPLELQNVLEAFKALTAEQKDFYDLEKGFNNKKPEVSLFKDLNDNSINLLREGFSRDNICDVKNEFYKMFEDEVCDQKQLESRCSHQPDVMELKTLLMNISNAL